MKLAILGGGGFRVPLVYRAVRDHDGPGRPDVVALYDVARDRLAVIERVLADLGPSATGAPGPRVETTTDLAVALDGADVVFAAIRVGGLTGRVADERVALDLGVLGQETTGPGGVAFGLRTVPTMLELAAAVRRYAPSAWTINFTNPAGMITEALQPVLGERVIGICDSPMGLVTRAERALGIAGADVDYAGLNHLGWLAGLRVDGVDRLPELLADPVALVAVEEGRLVGPEWIQAIGAVPNEYVYYYDFTREAIAGITAAPETRAEFLLRSQGEFFERAADRTEGWYEEWDRVRLDRNTTYMADARGGAERHEADIEGGGYEGVAVALMSALAGGPPAALILNVRNGDTQPALPADAVIEVPCRVDATGARPLPVSPLTGERLGLVQQVKAVEQLTIAAAVTGDERLAVRALAAHPLVDSVTVARSLLAGYRSRIPELDAVLAR